MHPADVTIENPWADEPLEIREVASAEDLLDLLPLLNDEDRPENVRQVVEDLHATGAPYFSVWRERLLGLFSWFDWGTAVYASFSPAAGLTPGERVAMIRAIHRRLRKSSKPVIAASTSEGGQALLRHLGFSFRELDQVWIYLPKICSKP
jgi:hypothetical protein